MHDAAVRQEGDRLLLYLVHQSITAVLGWLGKVLLVHPMLAAGTAPHSSEALQGRNTVHAVDNRLLLSF